MKLNDYKKYFDLSYDQFITQHNIRSSEVAENVRYEKITGVSRVNLPHDQYFFFKEGKMQMIYISDKVLAKKLWDEFKSTTNTNTPERTVRSRAGKTSNQVIFAGQGITASVSNGGVDFIEIYPPCKVQDYLQHIYKERMPFIR